MTRAVFLDHPSLDLGDLDLAPLRARFAELVLHQQTAPEQVAERLKGAQVAISNKVRLDAATFAACPELKLVLIAATGTNNVDLAAARAHGVTVCNCQGYGTPSVAQHTLMLLLALATRLPDYQRAVRDGRWQQAQQFCLLDFPIVELEGKTLGLLGHGELGSAVAQLARAFGMRVLLGLLPGRPAHDGRLPLDELLPQVDALTLHCPLTEQTRHLIGAREIALMKPTAFLINTARGGLVDEQALVTALKEGLIAGAGFDVLTKEPPKEGNPLLDLRLPNFILTPHVAWASDGAMQFLADQLIDNVELFIKGTPQHLVT